MKITIRTNPEIVIEAELIEEEKKVEQTIVVPHSRVVPDVKPDAEGKVEKRDTGVRHCKCAEKGRRSDNCPNEAGGTIAENIQNLKGKGLSSDEIADSLGLSLAIVNRY